MRTHHLYALVFSALLSGCFADRPSTEPVSLNPPIRLDTTTTGLGVRNSFDVRYERHPGDSKLYDLVVRQDIDYVISGADTLGAISADPLPASGRVISRAAAQISYDALETSTNAAATIKISAAFPSVESSAWADGHPIDEEVFDELTRALAVINPVDFTVGVNDRNAVLTSSGLGGLNVLNGEVGSLTSLSNNQLSRPLGPVFPESRQVSMFRPWTVETTQEAPGDQTVVVTSEYTAVEYALVDDRNLLKIEGTTHTDGFELDFSSAFQQIYAGLIADGSGRQLTEPELAALADVVFSISVRPSSGTSEYLFDVDSQVIVSSSQESIVELVWVLQVPETDSTTASGFELTMGIARRARFTLAS